MEIILDKTDIKFRREIFSSSASAEEMSDYVVPDALPDIGRIADVCGGVRIRGKEAASGSVRIDSAVAVTVLYVPEGESAVLRCLETEIPVSVSFDAPEADESTDIVADIVIDELEARILNPRKVLARCSVTASVRCFNAATLSIASGLRSETPLQILRRSCTAAPVSDVREKTFVISDEAAMPPSAQGYSQILCGSTQLSVNDVKFVGNKLIFKGEAATNILAQPEGGALPVSFNVNTGFSQIIEIGGASECSEVKLCLTGAYLSIVDGDGGKPVASVELHILAQAVSGENVQIEYIADAYSNRFSCEVSSETYDLPQCRGMTQLRDTFRVMLSTPETVSEVISANVMLAYPKIQGGKITTRASVRCMYLDAERAIRSAETVEELVIDAELPENVCEVSLQGGEIYAAPASGGVDIRMPVEAQVSTCPYCRIVCVSAVEEGEDCDRSERPSLYIIPGGSGAELWELAKKYCSTVELIESGGCERQDILLIPVQR